MPWFKRGFRGLYGNRMTRFGNQVSFAENKTRRTWKPNVQKKTLWSETLQERFKCRITTHVMRSVRKFGGLDGYLLRAKDSEIKYPRALKFKQRIIAARKRNASLVVKNDQSDTQNPGIIESVTAATSTAPLGKIPRTPHSAVP